MTHETKMIKRGRRSGKKSNAKKSRNREREVSERLCIVKKVGGRSSNYGT